MHYLFRAYTIFFENSLFVSRIHYLSREFTIYIICFANSISVSRIDYLFHEFTMLSLSVSRIQYLFREFTICFTNSLSFPRIHYLYHLFRKSTICFANSSFSLSRYMMTQIKRYAYYVTLCLRHSLNDSYDSYNWIKKCFIICDDSYKRDDNVI